MGSHDRFSIAAAQAVLVGVDMTEPKFQEFLTRMLKELGGASPKTLASIVADATEVLDPHSEENEDLVAIQLDRQKPGRMRRRLANAHIRTMVPSSFEGVWLRKVGEDIQVFLKKRPADEDHGDQYHCPGTIIRAGVEWSEDDVMNRLAEDFGGEKGKAKFKKCWKTGDWFPARDVRGLFICHVFVVEPQNKEPGSEFGSWYSIKKLPSNMVPHHIKIIRLAAKWRYR